MKRYQLFRFDLSKRRDYERYVCLAKYFFIPTPRDGVFFSFTRNGHKINLGRVSEIFISQGITEFYISNEPMGGEFLLYAVNCGMNFEDTYSYDELLEVIEHIRNKWSDLLET
jgi:hypothetical protein